MAGSGLDNIQLDADLFSGGSLADMMSSKHFDRALHCNKIMLGCLKRLLIDEYLREKNL